MLILNLICYIKVILCCLDIQELSVGEALHVALSIGGAYKAFAGGLEEAKLDLSDRKVKLLASDSTVTRVGKHIIGSVSTVCTRTGRPCQKRCTHQEL